MVAHLNHYEQLIIVVHEIYGINEHMEMVCNYYSQQGFDILCPNLLNLENPFGYDQEQAAYEHFMKQVGFVAATSQVKKLIQKMRPKYKYIFFIGFSAGATIAWLCSEENEVCDGVIGYYGSRIRDYLPVNPSSPVLLIYPAIEEFDLPQLETALQTKDKVDVRVLQGKHGFSNPFFKDYCELSHKLSLEMAAEFLDKCIVKK